MAVYNLFCSGYFNSLSSDENHQYYLGIYKKNYTGSGITVNFGANPVIHEWQDDDPQKPIKGSSLRISIINEGNISLEDFYSNDDDTFMIILFNIDLGDEILFNGYLVQDDCAEIMVDYAHEIQLSATDNLGILKDYTFDQAATKFGPFATSFGVEIQTVTDGITNYIQVNETFSEEYNKIKAGNIIEITGGTYFDGTYTVLNVSANPSFGFLIQVVESVGGNSSATLCNLRYQIPYDISSYLSIREILRLCLFSTNIELTGLRVLSKIKPYGKDRWIDDTYIDCRSYVKDNTYYDCYKILEDLMIRFRASLFQAYGFWYITRIGEYSMCNDYSTTTQYVNNYQITLAPDLIRGDIVYINSGLDNRFLNIDLNMAENGILKSLLRPYNYTKENFNYNVNQNLLVNGDLQQLGNFITSYTSGSDIFYEYEAPGFDYYFSDSSELKYYIRVVFNADNEETNRYLVLEPLINPEYISTNAIRSKPIPVSKGEIITIKYNTRTSTSHGYTPDYPEQISIPYLIDSSSYVLHLKYTNDINNTSTVNGSWATNGDVQILWGPNEDTINWKSIVVQSQPAPIDGLFYIPFSLIGLFIDDLTSTFFNDLSVTISSIANTQTNIIGHYHKTTCNTNIKNYDEVQINLDDTKSNSISGTLYLETETSGIRDRVQKWDYENSCQTEYADLTITSSLLYGILISPTVPSDITSSNYPSGTELIVSGGTSIDGTYTISSIEPFGPSVSIFTVESLGSYTGTATLTFNIPFQALKLGQHTTFEQMYLRWKTRPKLDINILKVIGTSGNFFGAAHLVKYYGLQDIIFFLGSISINYRTDSAQCTLYGLVNQTEKRSDLEAVSSYEFNYLYENS